MKKQITVGIISVMFSTLSASQAFAKQCPLHSQGGAGLMSGAGLSQYFSLGLMLALLMSIAVLKVLSENGSKLEKNAPDKFQKVTQDPAREICKNLNFGENFASWSQLKKMAQTRRPVS